MAREMMQRETANRPERSEGQRTAVTEPRQVIAPPVDIYENDDEILLVADVPGVDSDNVKIRLDKGELTLEARRTISDEGRVLARDYQAYDYGRRFLVPGGIDGSKIEAQLKNGVLFLHLPKAETARPREIPVKTR